MPKSAVRHVSCVALPCVFAALLVGACGGSDGSEVDGGNGNGNGNGTGATGSAPPPSLGGGVGGPGTGGGTISAGSECAKGTAAAEAIPAVVQMVVDISGSMEWGIGGRDDDNPLPGQSKWEITSAALKEAVATLPASVAAGLSFYPNSPRGAQCIRNNIAVPIGLLGASNSPQRGFFGLAIDLANPGGGTPTHAAYQFGLSTVRASNLVGKKFVLLITDGEPTYNLDCSGDGEMAVPNAPLIAAVADAYGANEPVSTFVIGSPGSDPARGDLSRMASAGGTAKAGCSDAGPAYCHLDMTTASDFGAALRQGLAEVAGAIGTCEYAVPAAPPGLTLDPSLVNVLYTKGDGSQTSIPKDAKGDCSSGWKYDSEVAPTKITLCGTDCDTVEKDTTGKIDVIFGCQTETNVPR
jgi:hypothetical protein